VCVRTAPPRRAPPRPRPPPPPPPRAACAYEPPRVACECAVHNTPIANEQGARNLYLKK
jgi:hypothetical protein